MPWDVTYMDGGCGCGGYLAARVCGGRSRPPLDHADACGDRSGCVSAGAVAPSTSLSSQRRARRGGSARRVDPPRASCDSPAAPRARQTHHRAVRCRGSVSRRHRRQRGAPGPRRDGLDHARANATRSMAPGGRARSALRRRRLGVRSRARLAGRRRSQKGTPARAGAGRGRTDRGPGAPGAPPGEPGRWTGATQPRTRHSRPGRRNAGCRCGRTPAGAPASKLGREPARKSRLSGRALANGAPARPANRPRRASRERARSYGCVG